MQKLKSVWYVVVRACREKARGLLSQLAGTLKSSATNKLLDDLHRAKARAAAAAARGGAGVAAWSKESARAPAGAVDGSAADLVAAADGSDPRMDEYLRIVEEAFESQQSAGGPEAGREMVLRGKVRVGSVLAAGISSDKCGALARSAVMRRLRQWGKWERAEAGWGKLERLHELDARLRTLLDLPASSGPASSAAGSESAARGTAAAEQLRTNGALLVSTATGSVYGSAATDWIKEAVLAEQATGAGAAPAASGRAGRPLGVGPKSNEERADVALAFLRSKWNGS